MTNRLVKDKLSFSEGVDMPNLHKSGLWARTEIIGGYGDLDINPIGKSTIGEVCFRTENIVPVGGVSYVMQNLFDVQDDQIDIPTLYEETGIGLTNSTPPTETYLTPKGEKSIIYRHGNCVQLFGVGITGTAENDITIYSPDYREKSIDLSKVNSDGLTVTGTMLPFRYTEETLNASERKQYFGKKKDSNGITGYYLKRFEYEPIIKHIWKTGEDVENETLVPSSDIWINTSGLNAVESFTEIILKINKKDIKEWFEALEQPDRTRINTIALFNGQYIKDKNNAADDGDYRDVRLFSKLCINPEYLNLNKDLNIIYRVYGA